MVEPMDAEERRVARLKDAGQMRVMAHPLRLRLLGELRIRGPQSVGMLSDLVDEAPGTISYHVGKLAEFGFVEAAPELARDRRERWWRAAQSQTSWDPVEALDDPDRQAASDSLRRAALRANVAGFERYLEAEPAMEREWVRGATGGDTFLHLTSDELLELRTDLLAFVARWQTRSDPDRAEARPVTLMYQTFRRP
jgi:DNA-binding transcriptional ArsR family regulator